jgi:hypothetical protein
VLSKNCDRGCCDCDAAAAVAAVPEPCSEAVPDDKAPLPPGSQELRLIAAEEACGGGVGACKSMAGPPLAHSEYMRCVSGGALLYSPFNPPPPPPLARVKPSGWCCCLVAAVCGRNPLSGMM